MKLRNITAPVPGLPHTRCAGPGGVAHTGHCTPRQRTIRFQLLLLLWMWALLLGPMDAFGALAGDEVVVVYNQAVPASEQVARHYAEARHVPDNQVIGFALPTSEEMSRAEYNDRLAGPLARELERRQLWRMDTHSAAFATATNPLPLRIPVASSIRYVVLCYGVPLKIRNEPGLDEPGRDEMKPELRVNHAAVDSELATLPLPANVTPRFGMLRNTSYTTTDRSLLNPTNGILMVTRLDGPTPDVAMHLVDKTMEAETNGYWGRAYFDIRSITDTNYQPGDEWIRSAYEICRVMGFECLLDTNSATIPASVPMSHIAFYAGWYEEHPSGPFRAPEMEFMPGAFAYHLHSASAYTIRSTELHWVGPLLAKGAACTMGSVYEPYLSGTPDIGTFTARWLITGFTFGEAAYASQAGLSWQTTVVGDPLYRAFAMHPQLLQIKLEATHSPLAAWLQLRLVNLNRIRGAPVLELAEYLDDLPLTRQSPVLMEKLGDLDAAAGKPESTLFAYRQALQLAPSPQQHIRLMLKLGDALTAQGRLQEAATVWSGLVNAFPEYPGRPEIAAKRAGLEATLRREAATNRIGNEPREIELIAPTNQPVR